MSIEVSFHTSVCVCGCTDSAQHTLCTRAESWRGAVRSAPTWVHVSVCYHVGDAAQPTPERPSRTLRVLQSSWLLRLGSNLQSRARGKQRKCDLCALPCWEEPCIFFSRPSRRRRLSSRTCPPGCRSWRGGTRTRWPPARSRPAPGGGLRVPPRGGARRGALAGGLGRRLPPRAWGRPSPRRAPRARADTWHANTRPST